MNSNIRPGQSVLDYFVLTDNAGTPVTGQTEADFTDVFTLNGSIVSIASSIEEVDPVDAPGQYTVAFTAPVTLGALFITVNHPLAPGGLSEQYFIAPFMASNTGNQLVTITVNDGTNPISGVRMTVLDQTETQTIVENLTTNSVGQVQIGLDNGTYKVLLSKQLIQFNATEDLVVSGTTTVTYTGTPVTVLASDDDAKTILSGFVNSIIGENKPNYEIVFELMGTNLFTKSGVVVDRTPVVVYTDQNGFFAVELYRTVSLVTGKSNRAESRYKITFPATGDEFLFQLPNQASVNIGDVQFDNSGTNEWVV